MFLTHLVSLQIYPFLLFENKIRGASDLDQSMEAVQEKLYEGRSWPLEDGVGLGKNADLG